MSSSQVQAITAVGAASCWGVLVFAWVAGAAYNAFRGPKERTRRQYGSARFVGAVLVVAIVVAAVILAVPGSGWAGLMLRSPWGRLPGLVILVVSTGLALWARLALGTMWSLGPVVKDGHELRVDGPYAVTRHPIYTGLLGMLLGTVVVAGVGRAIVILPVAVVLLEVKLRMEERLMLEAFPAEYARYRRRVPALVPGVRLLRRVVTADR